MNIKNSFYYKTKVKKLESIETIQNQVKMQKNSFILFSNYNSILFPI